MFNLNLIMTPICFTSSTPSTVISALISSGGGSVEKLFNSANVLMLLTVLFIIFVIYSLATEIKLLRPLNASKIYQTILTDSCDPIETKAIIIVSFSSIKRPFESDVPQDYTSPKNKITKLVISAVFEEFMPMNFVFSPEFNFCFPDPTPPNHDCITLVKDDDNEDDQRDAKQDTQVHSEFAQTSEVQEKKTFNWYLRWDLPDEELENLSYSEKTRRFYHLSTFGEFALPAEEEASEAQPRRFQLEDNKIFTTGNSRTSDIVITGNRSASNLILDLALHVHRIDIPKFQVELLKCNILFICGFLKTQKRKFLQQQFSRIFFNPHVARYYKKPFSYGIEPPKLELLKLRIKPQLYNSKKEVDDIVLSGIGKAKFRKNSLDKGNQILNMAFATTIDRILTDHNISQLGTKIKLKS